MAWVYCHIITLNDEKVDLKTFQWHSGPSDYIYNWLGLTEGHDRKRILFHELCPSAGDIRATGTLKEIQVKAFDFCTTYRSLIMKNDFSMNSEFDSCGFYVNVASLNSNKVQIFWNLAPPFAQWNLPQISCMSCQMVLFYAFLLSFSTRQTLQFNTTFSEPN